MDDAKTFADSGDYASAIALIKNAQETQGDDAEYQNAFKTYSSAYKTEVITSADSLAANGDYVGALEAIGTASAVIGEDSSLSVKATEYENAYVSDMVIESDTYLAEDNYTEALTTIEFILTKFPQNDQLLAQKEKIELAMPKNFMEVCTPYHFENCEAKVNGQYFMMAGVKYTNGFVQNAYGNGQILSNLEGRYSEIMFLMGHIDDTAMCNYTVEIYLDGILYDNYEVKATGLPLPITIPVTGKNQLRIDWLCDHSGQYQDGCRLGFANMVIKSNPNPSHMDNGTVSEATKYFMDICAPYQYENCEAKVNGQYFMMAGTKDTNGFAQNAYGNGQILSNLGGKYTELTLTMVHVDETAMCDYEVQISLDGILYDSYEIKATNLPLTITIPISEKYQLGIDWRCDHSGQYQDGCRLGFADLKIQ